MPLIARLVETERSIFPIVRHVGESRASLFKKIRLASTLSTTCFARGGNESQLPKESETIPIHPAFHNSPGRLS